MWEQKEFGVSVIAVQFQFLPRKEPREQLLLFLHYSLSLTLFCV